MGFWELASSATASSGNNRPAGPARPLTVVLHAPHDFNTLVRLRIKVSNASAALSASDDEEDAEASMGKAAAALGKLHQLIISIEAKSADACKHSITEVLSLETLQLLCQKAAAPKVYKSLMPHQTSVGFSLGDVKSCINLTPLAVWELHEALQTAVIKSLTGSSCGTCSSSSARTSSAPASTAGGSSNAGVSKPGGEAAAATTSAADTETAAAGGSAVSGQWMCLSRQQLVGCNLLTCQPGVLLNTACVEFECRAQPPRQVLLMIKSAGSVKFRMFSPMQTLSAEAKSLKAPLCLTDSDACLLGDPAKLAAAAKQLDGRPVKLLPDGRVAFIKSLKPTPTNPDALQALCSFWLGHHGLLLPRSFPFLLGVASHSEAEAAALQVPSCCVLSNMGLTPLPGSAPGGAAFAAALQLLLEGLRGSQLQLLGPEGFRVETDPAGTGAAGISDAQMQVSSQGGPGSQASSDAAAALQPKAFSMASTWTTAADMSKLQSASRIEAAKAVAAAGAASKQRGGAAGKAAAAGGTAAGKGQQQQQKAAAKPPLPSVLTTSSAQLLGLQEVQDVAVLAGSTNNGSSSSSAGSSSERQQPLLAARKSGNDFSSLKAFLAEQRKQQEQEARATGSAGPTAPAATGSSRSSSTGTSSSSNSSKPGIAHGRPAVAVGVAGGPPAVPKFGSRKPGLPAAATAARKPAAKKPPAGPGASLAAAVAAARAAGGSTAAGGAGAALTQPGGAAAAAAAPAVPAAPVLSQPKAPAVGAKRAGAAAAGGKAPVAKKPKAAVDGTASKGKTAKKQAAAAGAGAAAAGGSTDAAAAGAAAGDAAGTPAAAAAAPERKRTKASDLDLAVVAAKVLAAFAAGGGSSLKGLSVPEMQCYLRAQGQRGGPTKKAEVEARLLALLAGQNAGAGADAACGGNAAG